MGHGLDNGIFPMGHGLYNGGYFPWVMGCTTPLGIQILMGHELCNTTGSMKFPWVMDCATGYFPMALGLYNDIFAHGS